jgi:hypothetical protein
MTQLDFRHSLGPLCGAVTLAAVVAASALHAGFGQKAADAAEGEGESVTPVFAYDLPHLPGQKMSGDLVEYAPGGNSPAAPPHDQGDGRRLRARGRDSLPGERRSDHGLRGRRELAGAAGVRPSGERERERDRAGTAACRVRRGGRSGAHHVRPIAGAGAGSARPVPPRRPPATWALDRAGPSP